MNYFLQDSRTYTGNDLMFWAKDGKGYTSDVRQAHVYTQEEALRQHRARPSDIPWPCDYILARTRPVVDHQTVKRAEALAGTGIELSPVPCQAKAVRLKCHGCHVFMSEASYWSGACTRTRMATQPSYGNWSGYRHEMTDADHAALASALHHVQGMVVLSGYACDLYDQELYVGWERHERAALADGARSRTEVLWLNPACSAALRPQRAPQYSLALELAP